jgi:sugar lactone lactonase YvrE
VEGTTLLVVLDAQTLAQVAEVQVPTKRPASGIDSLALSPDEKTLYCGYAWDDGKGVYAVDTEKNELRPDWVAEVEAERLEVFQVWPLVMHPSGRYLLGVEWGPSDKMVPRRVVAKPPPLPQDQELSWSRQAHCVTLIDVLEKRIVTRLQIGRRPSGIVLSTDGNTLYTCDRVTGRVYFVNLSELLTRPVPGASEPDGNAGDK